MYFLRLLIDSFRLVLDGLLGLYVVGDFFPVGLAAGKKPPIAAHRGYRYLICGLA